MMRRRVIVNLLPAAILLVIAAVVVLAPQEKSLGEGIKSVYVHVALTWTGMAGLTLAGLLGIVMLVNQSERLQRWAQALGWVSIALFAGGFVMSMVAAQVNWGGIFWAEPRTTMALQIISVTLIVQVLCSWIQRLRVQALLHIGAALFMTWRIISTELVLHPQSPILNSDSLAIQLTFGAVFLLVVVIACWLVWRLMPSQQRTQ